tara:strand:+ start:3514 stop:4632 length:1119 start_codon:yes stop_codon:yes gene_type:complete
MKIVNRFLLCSSVFQLIIFKSILKKRFEENVIFNDYVIINNRNTIDSAKDLIINYSNILNIKKVFDLRDIVPNENVLFKNNKYKTIKSLIKNRVLIHYIKNIKNIIYSEVNTIDEVYYRLNYNLNDLIIINSLINYPKFFVIEDGMGDYFTFKHKSVNIYELKNYLSDNLKKYFARIILTYLSQFKIIYPKPLSRFTNLPFKKNISVGKEFKIMIEEIIKKKNISKISEKEIILILGAPLLSDASRYNFDIDQEINMYNKLFNKIKYEHKIDDKNIYYKHHPRLSLQNWKIKKDKLLCNMLPYERLEMAEVELLINKVIHIYSVGSTTLIYSKKIFGVEGTVIDLTKYKLHKSHFLRTKTLYQDFDINVIEV